MRDGAAPKPSDVFKCAVLEGGRPYTTNNETAVCLALTFPNKLTDRV